MCFPLPVHAGAKTHKAFPVRIKLTPVGVYFLTCSYHELSLEKELVKTKNPIQECLDFCFPLYYMWLEVYRDARQLELMETK